MLSGFLESFLKVDPGSHPPPQDCDPKNWRKRIGGPLPKVPVTEINFDRPLSSGIYMTSLERQSAGGTADSWPSFDSISGSGSGTGSSKTTPESINFRTDPMLSGLVGGAVGFAKGLGEYGELGLSWGCQPVE